MLGAREVKKAKIDPNKPWRTVFVREHAGSGLPYFLVQVWLGRDILGQGQVECTRKGPLGIQKPKSPLELEQEVDRLEAEIRGKKPFNRWEWIAGVLTNQRPGWNKKSSKGTEDSLRAWEKDEI